MYGAYGTYWTYIKVRIVEWSIEVRKSRGKSSKPPKAVAIDSCRKN